ncbi:unnamed protein product, partial [Prorocentrum cordatum]
GYPGASWHWRPLSPRRPGACPAAGAEAGCLQQLSRCPLPRPPPPQRSALPRRPEQKKH